jgi:ankyrin repeat protein
VNNVTVAKMLLKINKTCVYTTNSSGLCPVHVAAISGHLKVLIKLFKHCPDSDQLLDSQGRNFLHLAVKEKRVGIVRWICKNSIDHERAINAQDYQGNTPLHLAVRTRDPTVVCHLLLSRRAPLNWVNKNELTPLDIADEQIKDGFSDMKVHDLHQPLKFILYLFYKISPKDP